MIKTDPIIAVKDVESSSKWYQKLFGCESIHDGSEFDVLVNKSKEVILCLHKWGEHEHPTMQNPAISAGNGLILYFRTDKLETVYENAQNEGLAIERPLQLNPNSHHKEFSLRDLDGYYLTISAYHNYQG